MLLMQLDHGSLVSRQPTHAAHAAHSPERVEGSCPDGRAAGNPCDLAPPRGKNKMQPTNSNAVT